MAVLSSPVSFGYMYLEVLSAPHCGVKHSTFRAMKEDKRGSFSQVKEKVRFPLAEHRQRPWGEEEGS